MSKPVEYFSVTCCVACKEPLNDNEVMYSSGTCPECGNINDSTIVDHFKKLAVRVQINPKWKFWLKTYTSLWAEDFKLTNKDSK